MKRLTVTIGIPVHNEAANILYLLRSLVNQRGTSFTLEHIYVMCDGTTDESAEIARNFAKRHPNIKVLNDGRRIGKLGRLNNLYRTSRSDIVCVFDGDMGISDSHVLERMIKHFDSDTVGMVCANNQPVASPTLVGRLINYWSFVWYLSRISWRGGNNIHNARGCAVAVRRSVARHIQYPPEIVSDSQYLYFATRKLNYEFRFAIDAIVMYRKPSSLTDYLTQINRASAEKSRLDKYFGRRIASEYIVPRSYTLRALWRAYTINPLYALGSMIFTIIATRLPFEKGTGNRAIWRRVASTKMGINPVHDTYVSYVQKTINHS